MEFRIADTFAESLSRLTGDEQKAVKTTAFDLQMDLGSPGMRYHRLEKARDKSFWSVRVNEDIRIIVHRTSESLLLCYVNHHDEAYRWAEKRRLEVHPRTGALQLVEIRERVEEIVVPRYVEARPVPAKPLFSEISDGDLLSYGVPEEWLADVHAADEVSLLELAGHLPGEAAEALLNLATGVTPRIPQQVPFEGDPYTHPDAQRRFRTICNAEDLECALEYPWKE